MPLSEAAIDLFAELMPRASEVAREYVLARTPPELQPLMQRLVNAGTPSHVALSRSTDVSYEHK